MDTESKQESDLDEKIKEYSIVSWNVDGLTDDIWEFFQSYLLRKKPHIVCLNETKKPESRLRELFSSLKDYNFLINTHNPTRWHGVAILIHKDIEFESVPVILKCKPRKGTISNDAACGRVITIKVDNKFNLVATYNPNSGVRGLKNLDYRIKEWDPALFSYLNSLSEIKPTIWIGDVNVCSENIDVSNPGYMQKWAGFTKQERDSFNKFLNPENQDNLWIDIWRLQHPEDKIYSYRGYNAKNWNYGMRLDNTIISKELKDKVIESLIETDFDKDTFSSKKADTDHVPISIKLKI